MMSTVSKSSEATYKTDFNTPRKPAAVPLRENTNACSTAKGGRRKESVHTVSCHSASVRSCSGSNVVADKLAMRTRIKSESRGLFSGEARSIRLMSAYSNRSAGAGAPGRDMRSRSILGNEFQGGSSRHRVQSNRSLSKSQTSRSQPTCSFRSPVKITLDTSSSFNTSSMTSTSNYPSSHPSLLFDPTQFDEFLCNALVDYYIILFSKRYQLDINTKHMLENNLHHIFSVHNIREAEHIGAAMREIYNTHVVSLDYTLNDAHKQLADLNQVIYTDANVPVNLDIDVVVSAPADDARNDRALLCSTPNLVLHRCS